MDIYIYSNWLRCHTSRPLLLLQLPATPSSPTPTVWCSVSAKSCDKMHNNFIHSGRCHKSVLNRVNNFVQRLPDQTLNCEESCCDRHVVHTGPAPANRPPVRPMSSSNSNRAIACCVCVFGISFLFIFLRRVYCTFGSLRSSLDPVTGRPAAMARSIHTCKPTA